uniref:Uncharacterized protein n=1 Tax=Nelumbo nucifera TaxID=4432 RepID=A0A822Y3H7_NELNU|nr:TPA_asm: hypothetical protein HUJ06_028445 [Nelumbo nucifera]
MARDSIFIFSLVLFFLLSSANASENPNSVSSSVHEELRKNGFPTGLLPTNVVAYTLNRTSGDFSVNLGDSCKVLIPPDNYETAYSKKITGKLIHRRIANLDGIRVRAFFTWWSITGIISSGENLILEAGIGSATYPSKSFEESLTCKGQRSS